MRLWFFIWSRRLIRIFRPKTRFRKKISDADILYTWDWSVEEVAELFGIHPATVYQRRSKMK